jgi:DNA-binding CsgD family transcriptional regulator
MALDDQLGTLRRVGRGGLLVDRRGCVTSVGDGVILGDGLDVTTGWPRAAFPVDQPALDLLIAVATTKSAPSALPPPPVVALHRPSGKRPLVVRAMPLDGARGSLLAPAIAILLVTDLDTAPSPAVETMRMVFGLTPKEAALAARLAAGDTVERAAETLAITTAHARQRLKVVFDKTDTRRQSELIALLARIL